MKWFLSVVALFACALLAHAGPLPPVSSDVPDEARNEIARRGNHAERTGTIRNGTIAAALAPPADDSAKWYATLVYKPGDPASERMRKLIATDKAVKPWINTTDPDASMMHYQERNVDDPTQAYWLSGVQTPIREHGLPLLVIQPPRNGQFGPNATIVKLLHGSMPADELVTRLRNGITDYLQHVDTPRGHQADNPIAAVAPPFQVPSRQPHNLPPANDPAPFEWPPATPKPLSLDEIRVLCPGATPDFLIEAVSSKETSRDVIALKWLVYQQQHPTAPPAEPTAAVPFQEPAEKPHPLDQYKGALLLLVGLCLMPILSKGVAIVRDIRAALATLKTSNPTNPPTTPVP